ncbi:hypothetical protein A2962_00735 [Candidatus Woesebacteria bacterium RIFCSPLOWO2_01_FULL_39_61]|uniref:Uncharacterized protein n=1 Tax=Candidatus Woesebacteria bacterium RIFCSPHIGHO2_02_FULL_39_13 TaxID=1802505 RepID=A0A1F7Z458_9BACT|nr:MAG: hypothetical protein A2692_04870 [Candidatus Woesebacteria bacterium RIFCSPHIGHO2_01_FULL_39_95]OGM33565.1 MAG: hypothetical protein A3D01_01260 [Candidatus Woesebacteria bacterium RIFCSPHIGHO2_02_FULL_39_13]OGM36705.1 MAG: hypothetical protein A3E13_00230 [Candidatus Woesebacteria bacterium RIFCSPHIGHO2_12_FULL_40_20]OGM68578.1 MAG: hypothetical protein A2962_00735 [Candidatus Woesebacteria bacterium RIFCSPLOWO2_01_FULL_39_61]OGM71678.1 MAG: hypothetical protein A3H19_01520 [Candidatus
MKKQKAPRLVTVAIFTTVTLIFWVFFSLYNILTSKPVIHVDSKLLEPLDPNLDRNALGQLGSRVFFEEEDVDFTTIPSIILVTPTPTDILPETEQVLTPTPAPTGETTPLEGG